MESNSEHDLPESRRAAAFLESLHRVDLLCLCHWLIAKKNSEQQQVGHEGFRRARLLAMAIVFSVPAGFLLWQLTVVGGWWKLGLLFDLVLGVIFWQNLYRVLYFELTHVDYVALPQQPNTESAVRNAEQTPHSFVSTDAGGIYCRWCDGEHDDVTSRCSGRGACFRFADHQ